MEKILGSFYFEYVTKGSTNFGLQNFTIFLVGLSNKKRLKIFTSDVDVLNYVKNIILVNLSFILGFQDMINGTSQTVAVIHAFCVRELPVTRKFVPSLNDTGQKT